MSDVPGIGKAVEKLGIGKAVEKLTDPVVDLFKRVAGPAADEIGLTLQDAVHVWRAKRAYRLAEKFRQFVEERGMQPKSVNLKLLLPILDNASVEEDEDLHTMWAALLTNAAAPAGSDVLPSFVEVLKQLTKSEAVFLNKLYEAAMPSGPDFAANVISKADAFDLWYESEDSVSALFEVSVDDLHRLGLIRTQSYIHLPELYASPTKTDHTETAVNLAEKHFTKKHMRENILQSLDFYPPQPTINEAGYYLTDYGVKFVLACRCPKKPPSTSAR